VKKKAINSEFNSELNEDADRDNSRVQQPSGAKAFPFVSVYAFVCSLLLGMGGDQYISGERARIH
jgi:hypothetical protein